MLISETCSFSYYAKKRPEHVKLINELHHNICMCTYHSNFIDAVNALHKFVPDVPEYGNGFMQMFLCKDSSQDCWFGKCAECKGISIDKLREAIGDTPSDTT